MKTPKRLESLIEDGLIDEVIRQMMSGKEATIFVVRCGEETRCAKVYKEANQRSFRQSTDYTENRKTKNSRQARAVEKGTRFGRKVQEQAWQSAEVDALYRLNAAGVRVPKPYNFHEGVLLMELIVDEQGHAAPRLHDLVFTREQAIAYHAMLLLQVVRMLCSGVIHGDLSEYNILIGHDGPVIIDLPQAVDATGNNLAKQLLERDVNNLKDYFGRFAPELIQTNYGKEIWALYAQGILHPEVTLTGHVDQHLKQVDVGSIMREIDSAYQEELAKRAYRSMK